MNASPKDVAAQFYAIMASSDAEGLRRICSSDMTGHAGAGANLTELVSSVGSFMAAFPDLTAHVRHLVCEGDLVSSWVTFTGTHSGDFAGVPGSGRQVKFAEWDLFRIQDGRIVELTQTCDLFTLLNQIGALPTTTPA